MPEVMLRKDVQADRSKMDAFYQVSIESNVLQKINKNCECGLPWT